MCPRLARDITASVIPPNAPLVHAWMPALAGSQPRAATTKAKATHIELAEGGRKASGIFSGEPVAREARNDATADEHDQEDRPGNPDTYPDVGRAVQVRLDVEGRVASKQDGEDGQHFEVRPVAPRDDLTRHRRQY